MKSGSLDNWRDYFRTANGDIFEVLDHAILVAAADSPKEFRFRRDGIAERLFSAGLTRCSGCNRVGPAQEGEEGGGIPRKKESNNGDEHEDVVVIGDVNENDKLFSNYSYGEAEALTNEIEEKSQVVAEILRIKDIVLNSQDESDSVLFESLRRLQLMALTVDTLKATQIGKAVNALRKHSSKQIRNLARTLIDEWKDLVDEWCNTTKAMKVDEGTPESVNPSVVDYEEEGLPSPPLDEGVFFNTQPIELSQFFDGMDDDGNLRNCGEFINNFENGRKLSLENHKMVKQKQQTPNDANVIAKDNKTRQMKRQEVAKPSKPSNTDSRPGRPPKQSVERRSNNDLKLQHKTDTFTIQRKPPSGQRDKFNCSDEVDVQMKLEAAKRKLQQSYQQAENAKRQRTIQVMELHDLPKQGLVHKNLQTGPGNPHRHWPHRWQ